MLFGLGIYSLFGTNGILNSGLFYHLNHHPTFDIGGVAGITLAEVLATFPPAVLVLVVALSQRDKRLYDAAQSMGASAYRIFTRITLPGCLFGLISAASIAFVLSTTDYGAPEMLAKKTHVLALDIGDRALSIDPDHSTSAVINIVLLLPTVIASALQLWMQRKQSAALTAKSVPMAPERNVLRDSSLLLTFCTLVATGILLVTAAAGLLAMAHRWPYSLYPQSIYPSRGGAFTFKNFAV